MSKKRELYVFSHIPKTAGFFFKHNIELSRDKYFMLRTSFAYNCSYMNQNAGEKEFFKGKESFDRYMNSLSKIQKDRMHCLAGHDSYYGIHSFFDRTPKYFTFIREPVDRTISLYNFERSNWDRFKVGLKNLNPQLKEYERRLFEYFLVDGRAPDFETWLEQDYNQKHIFYLTMTNYLQYLNFIDDKRDQSSIEDALKKFYFVGITESFNTDSAYLYDLFQVKSSMGERNIATPLVKRNELSANLIQKIKELNEDDMLLYECALRENAAFKKNTHDFYIQVNRSNRLRRIYYLIDWLKYGSVNTLKNILRPVLKPILVQLGWK